MRVCACVCVCVCVCLCVYTHIFIQTMLLDYVTKAKIGENKLTRFRKKYLKLKSFITLGSSLVLFKITTVTKIYNCIFFRLGAAQRTLNQGTLTEREGSVQ